MVAKDLETDDLVWAKMKGYPHWPGKIMDPPKGAKLRKGHHYVFFYDSNNYAWIHDDAIELHSETLVDKYTKGHKRPPSYLNAVTLIVEDSKTKQNAGKVTEKGNEELPLKRKDVCKSRSKAGGKKTDNTSNIVEEKEDAFEYESLAVDWKVQSMKEKYEAKKNSMKRSSSNDLDLSLSPTIPAKKPRNVRVLKSDPSRQKPKGSKLSEYEKPTDDTIEAKKSPSKKRKKDQKEEENNSLWGLIASDDESDKAARLIKDEIDKINASANIENEMSSNASGGEKSFTKQLDEEDDDDDLDGKSEESLGMDTELFVETSDSEKQVENDQGSFQEQKKAEKLMIQKRKSKDIFVTKKQKHQINDDQNSIFRNDNERQKYSKVKSRSNQRSIRIGLSKSQSGLSLAQRRKSAKPETSSCKQNDEPRDTQNVRSTAGSKRLRDEDPSFSFKPESSGFRNLIISDHSNRSECFEESNIDSSFMSMNPDSPSIDLSSENEVLKLKNVTPTKKKIGFIGLGSMGQRIVNNLIQSGHSVTVWNRTSSKCDNFSGAEKVETPLDLITACDIIFCCLANDAASKMVFFGNFGVDAGLRSAALTGEKKGFVEMTTIDPETSKVINLEVNLKRGRYLEAQFSGTKQQATEGNLLIVAAGDKTLFEDCQSCFVAIGKTSMLVSDQVGVASTYNTIHLMLYGSVYAALAEALALVESIGLQKEVFIDSFMNPDVKSVVNLDKDHLMGKSDCPVNMPLKHVQKSMSAALKLGSTFAQPMHVIAAVNEVYKHCKRLKFGNADISAVYKAARR